MRFSVESAANLWNLKDFVTFMFYWLLGAGVVFEMPLAMVVLARLGVVNVETLRKVRPYFLIGAFVVAAIITPPDPFTMAMVGVPLVILYEIGILAASIGATAIPNDKKTGK
jgi:sec-independent protein translocase protein TatC